LEGRHVRIAAEGKEQFLGLHADGASVVFKRNLLQVAEPARIEEFVPV
jgi:hypothetical protein